jgi:hypothetical protein
MQQGYSRVRTKGLPRITKRPTDEDNEQRLLQEVRRIDELLKSDNLTHLHGMIFSS